MKRFYIPHGADQQGRRATGVWTRPARTFDDGHFLPLSLPEAAHAATEEQGEEPPQERADKLLSGYARGIVSALLVGAIVALVLVVTR